MVGCSSTATPAATGDSTATATATASGPITVGFVAVGPEGGWRTANENNIKESFSTANGFELKYAPSNNGDQSSQITAFNSFIDQGVDAILLSATEATGWETVLKRAADAEIPVVLLDRGIEPDDSSLYTARIAPDNVGISKKAAEWAVTQFPNGTDYAVLEGPTAPSRSATTPSRPR